MAKRNLTLQLDDSVVQDARLLAAQRGRSISGLVADELTRLIDENHAYTEAKERSLRRLARGFDLGGGPYATRDELHER